LLRDRGHEAQEITVPQWADGDALGDLYTSIIEHRGKLLLVIKEIQETRDTQNELYGDGTNRAAWYERILVVLKEVTGPEDPTPLSRDDVEDELSAAGMGPIYEVDPPGTLDTEEGGS